MLFQNSLNRGPIASGRRNYAACAHDRFTDKGRDGVRAFAFDQRFEFGGAMRGELLFGHVDVRTAEVIRRLGVGDLFERQIEFRMEQTKARQRPRHQARAVIAAPARDDLFLFGSTEDVVVIPNEFDVRLVRIRPRQAKVNLGHVVRRTVEHHFRQGNRCLSAVADIGVVISQFARLISNGFGDVLTTVANVHAIEASKRIKELFAVAVFDVAAARGLNNTGRGFAAGVLGQVGRGVEKVLAVPLGQLVVR